MRLALALGRTATELEETLPEREWVEWMTFMENEPIGEARMDWRFAVLTAMFANANRAKETPAFAASEFVLMPEARTTRVNPLEEETIEDIARAWGAA
jgi:hypothetical protein